MERLTERDWKERFDLKELHPRYKRLAEYEDIELEPSEIAEHEEMFKAYRHACGGMSPEEISSLKEALERARIECKQLHDDMNEAQEEIDRLRSESYEYQRLEQEGLLFDVTKQMDLDGTKRIILTLLENQIGVPIPKEQLSEWVDDFLR